MYFPHTKIEYVDHVLKLLQDYKIDDYSDLYLLLRHLSSKEKF